MKKICLFFSLFSLTLTSFGQLANGLVTYFPFNGNAGDSSGTGNHGSVTGATLTFDRFGRANSAYNFDGNDYIQFDTAKLLNANFTFALWTKLDGALSSGPYALLYIGNVTHDHGFVVQSTYGWTVGTYNSDNTLYNVLSNKVDASGVWHHFVVTRNNSQIKLYRDGELIGTTSVTTGKIPGYNNNPNLGLIGRRSGTTPWYYKGVMDDVRIYNRAIDSSEVRSLYYWANTCYVTDTVTVNDTITHYDTLSVTDSVQVYDTLKVNVTVYDTTTVHDTIDIFNYVTVYDTLIVNDTNLIVVYDSIGVTDTLYINVILSFGGLPFQDLVRVFPNPANTHLNVVYDDYSLLAGYKIQLRNNLNQVVFSKLINSLSDLIDLSSLNGKGLYYFVIVDPNNLISESRKIILQ